MKITNRYNLPSAVLKAIEYDPHGGEAGRAGDISVTELIKAPQILELERQHWHELEADASDQMPRLIGQAVHQYLARFAKDENTLSEADLPRMTMDVTTDLGTWRVSGQPDAYELAVTDRYGQLIDYKYTNPWAFIFGDRIADWTAQLNLYRLLLRENDLPVNRLEVVPILREWDRDRIDEPNYPPAPSFSYKVKRWTIKGAADYLYARVRLHQRARLKRDVVPCDPTDRWYRGETSAVVDVGAFVAYRDKKRKTKPKATAVFGEGTKRGGGFVEAKQFAATLTKPHIVETRPGVSVRCERYCDVGRCGFCPQRASELTKGRKP